MHNVAGHNLFLLIFHARKRQRAGLITSLRDVSSSSSSRSSRCSRTNASVAQTYTKTHFIKALSPLKDLFATRCQVNVITVIAELIQLFEIAISRLAMAATSTVSEPGRANYSGITSTYEIQRDKMAAFVFFFYNTHVL